MSKISGAGEQMHLCLHLSAGGSILDFLICFRIRPQWRKSTSRRTTRWRRGGNPLWGMIGRWKKYRRWKKNQKPERISWNVSYCEPVSMWLASDPASGLKSIPSMCIKIPWACSARQWFNMCSNNWKCDESLTPRRKGLVNSQHGIQYHPDKHSSPSLCHINCIKIRMKLQSIYLFSITFLNQVSNTTEIKHISGKNQNKYFA